MTVITDRLPFFRQRWATRMTDSIVVKHPTGNVLDQTTGVYGPTFATVYEGPALIRPAGAGAANVGQETVATYGYEVTVPHTAIAILPEDLVDVTSASDPYLTGRQFVIRNIGGDTYVTGRHLQCEDVTSG